MSTKDPRIDAYIENAAAFAKPILTHFRSLVHKACPGINETMKWSFPHFDYKGIVCSMAAFKQHCAMGFWKASLMKDAGQLKEQGKNAMGNLGKITSPKDLPSDKILLAYIKEAVALNDNNIKPEKKKIITEKKPLNVPDILTKALSKNKKAKNTFENFTYSNKKEYTDWISEAKTEETKNKRLAATIQLLEEGKIRNWKYMKK